MDSRCAAQREGQFSSVVERPPAGLPPAPGDFSPSPLTLEGPGGFLSRNGSGGGQPGLDGARIGFAESPRELGASSGDQLLLTSYLRGCPGYPVKF